MTELSRREEWMKKHTQEVAQIKLKLCEICEKFDYECFLEAMLEMLYYEQKKRTSNHLKPTKTLPEVETWKLEFDENEKKE